MKNNKVAIIVVILLGYIWISGGLKSFGINPPAGISLPDFSSILQNPFTPTGPYCGDEYCDSDESIVNCPQDCGEPPGPRAYGPEFQGTCNVTQTCSGLVSPDYLSCGDLEGNCQQVRGGTPCYDSIRRNIGECCWC